MLEKVKVSDTCYLRHELICRVLIPYGWKLRPTSVQGSIQRVVTQAAFGNGYMAPKSHEILMASAMNEIELWCHNIVWRLFGNK